jgi:CHAD domain-containing protein
MSYYEVSMPEDFRRIESPHLFIQHWQVLASLVERKQWNSDALHQFRVNVRACLAWQPLWQITSLSMHSALGPRQLRRLLKCLNQDRDQDVFHTYLASLPHSGAARKKLTRPCLRKPRQKLLEPFIEALQQTLDSWQIWMNPALFQQQLSVLFALYSQQIQLQLVRCSGRRGAHLHALRLTIKSLRYLLEVAAAADPAYQPLWSHCRLWQDKLGQFADLDALARWLKRQDELELATLVRTRRRVLVDILVAEREDISRLLAQIAATPLPSCQQLAATFNLKTVDAGISGDGH